MGQTGWKSELSLLDEFFGQEPRYPLATEVEHQAYEFHKQNELMKKLSNEQQIELKNTTNQICGTINNGITELTIANKTGFKSINNSLESGFNQLNVGLDNLEYALENGFEDVVKHIKQTNRNLEQIDSTLRWGFGGIADRISITNQKLDEIIHLLNIPDSQKQRKYHVEEGLRCLIKTRSDEFFYSKALENFTKAIEIEELDYLSLQQLGIIHLYSKSLLDVEKARDYLSHSAKYSSADVGISNTANASSFNHLLNPSLITAKSLLHLSRSQFILEDYENAYENGKIGLTYNLTASQLFDLSKYASKLNKKDESIKFLEEAIGRDRYLSVKALNDEDLASKKYILQYLTNLTRQTLHIADKELKNVKDEIGRNSKFLNEVLPIEKQLDKNQYLRALQALELLGFELNN